MINLSDSQLLDAAPDAMIIADQSGVIVLVNRQTESLFGYTRKELLGQPIEVLLPDRYRATHPERRQEYIDRPRVRPMGQGLELFGKHRDGAEFPVEISLSPVESGDGVFVAAAIRDATAHKQLEQSLTGILETSLNEIFIFNATTFRFINVNRGARRNLGYTMDELRALTPADIKPEFTFEQFSELVASLRDNEQKKIEFETLHERKDGTRYPVEIHMQQSHFDATPVFVAIVLDTTERKQAEQALRENRDLLEQRVITRTAALEEAKKEAEKANAGKSRFLAAASHDLRQPLQSLGLYLSVMKRQLKSASALDQPKLIGIGDKMSNSLDTMSELLDSLLDISKLEGGSITPEKRNFRIQELIQRVITDNIQQAEEKGLRLEYDGNDCPVYSDPGLLERAIENLVTNAIRYTDEGRVTICCQSEDGVARIAVTDTGIGIPTEFLDKVFEEYYQLDNPVRDRSRGLGLGLSIVKHIVRLLEHRLDVDSEVGTGSTFSVDVPLGNEPEFTSIEESQQSVSRSGETIVLLIDDDPAIVDATTMLLESEGVRVHAATTGDEALSVIASGVRPDIVVSDYRLPHYDGIELIQRIRRVTDEELPAVLITGDTSSKKVELSRLANCTVLHKPVDTDRLIELIEEASA